jgi:hypothetical protein
VVIEDIGIGRSIIGVLHTTKIVGNQIKKIELITSSSSNSEIIHALLQFTCIVVSSGVSSWYILGMTSETPALGSSSVC